MSIHPLAIAYLEALKAMHDDEYSVASVERYRDARVALLGAGPTPWGRDVPWAPMVTK